MKSIAEVETAVNQELQVENSRFVILQEIEWPSTGGVDMDALPTKPVGIPFSRIRELRPAKTWKTWDNTVEIRTSDSRIAVRGTLDEVVGKLNARPTSPNTRKPFALTRREEQLHRMREEGYSFSQRALAFNTTALRIAQEDVVIDRKLEAAAASRGRVLIPTPEETLAMMRDPNIYPDAIT